MMLLKKALGHIVSCKDASRLVSRMQERSLGPFERWTLRLLQDRFVKLEIVESVSHETIRTTLKKTKLSLG